MKTLLTRTLVVGLLAGAILVPGSAARALPGDVLEQPVWTTQPAGLSASASLVAGVTTPRAVRFTFRNTTATWFNVGTSYLATNVDTGQPVSDNAGLFGWIPPHATLTGDVAVAGAATPRLRIRTGAILDVGVPRPVQTSLGSVGIVSFSSIPNGKRVVLALTNLTATRRDVDAEVVLVRPGTRQGIHFAELFTSGGLPLPARGSRQVTVDLVGARFATLTSVGLITASLRAPAAFSAGLTASPVALHRSGTIVVGDLSVTSTRAADVTVQYDVAMFGPTGKLITVSTGNLVVVPAGTTVPETMFFDVPTTLDISTVTTRVVRLKVAPPV